MATVLQDNTNKDEDQQQQLTGSAPVGGQTPMAPVRQGSSSRPNINQYLQANQGAGQKLAQGIQSKAGEQAQAFTRDVEQKGQALSNRANPLQTELGEEGSQRIQTAFKDPSSILNNQQELDQFQRLRDNAAATGIGEYQTAGNQAVLDLQSQQRKLQEQAQQAGSESGRFGLLRNAFGRPTYSRGQQKLDQLFLQAQPGAARGLQQNLRGLEQNAGKQITDFSTNVGDVQKSLTSLADQRAKEIQGLFGQGSDTQGIETDINQRGLSDIQAAAEQARAGAPGSISAAQALKDRFGKNQLTDADLQKLGLSSGQRVFNLDLGQYLSPEQRQLNDIGLSEFASPEEFARYNALRELGNVGEASAFGTATQGGGFNPYKFDENRFQSDLAAKKQQESDYINKLVTSTNYLANKARRVIGQPSQADPTYESGLPPIIGDAAESIAGAISGGGGMSARRDSPSEQYAYWNPRLQTMENFLKTPDIGSLEKIMNLSGYYSPNFLQNQMQSGVASDRMNAQQILDLFPELKALQTTRTLQATPEDIEGGASSSLADTFGVK